MNEIPAEFQLYTERLVRETSEKIFERIDGLFESHIKRNDDQFTDMFRILRGSGRDSFDSRVKALENEHIAEKATRNLVRWLVATASAIIGGLLVHMLKL